MKRLPLPDWLTSQQHTPDYAKLESRFFYRLAALYLTPEGTGVALAAHLDINYAAGKNYTQGRTPVPEHIRQLINRDLPGFFPPDPL